MWQIPSTRSKKGLEKYFHKKQTKQQLSDLQLLLTDVETIHMDWDDMNKVTLQYTTAVQHGLCMSMSRRCGKLPIYR